MVKYVIILLVALMLLSCNSNQDNIERKKYFELGGKEIEVQDTIIIDFIADTDYAHPDQISFILDLIIFDNINSLLDVKQLRFNITCDSAEFIMIYPQKYILAYKKIMKHNEIVVATNYIVENFSNKSFDAVNVVIKVVLEQIDLKEMKMGQVESNFNELVYFYVKMKHSEDSALFVQYDKAFREILNNYYYLVEIGEPYDKELKEILDIYQIIAPDSSNYIKPTFKR